MASLKQRMARSSSPLLWALTPCWNAFCVLSSCSRYGLSRSGTILFLMSSFRLSDAELLKLRKVGEGMYVGRVAEWCGSDMVSNQTIASTITATTPPTFTSLEPA